MPIPQAVWCRAAAFALSVFWVVPAVPAAADMDALVRCEVRARTASGAGDPASLDTVYRDPGCPGSVRGRALWWRHAGGSGPLTATDRTVLIHALDDPAWEVRRAALRLIGTRGERLLERQALKLATEDPEEGVRAEALRAVRRWSRQGHLYFLERALADPGDEVRAEALVNLAAIALGEIPGEILARVRSLTAAGEDSLVRRRALEALHRWDRLDWSSVAATLADWDAPERLRLAAMEFGDGMPDNEQKSSLLLGVLDAESSLSLAWEAYRRLRGTAASADRLGPAVARYLARSSHQNAATDDMAAFLRVQGYRVVHEGGSWKVSGRQ